MPVFNYATRELEFKIVYHGPPHAGKTTNLLHLKTHIAADAAEPITAFETGADRTLSFQFRGPPLDRPAHFHARFLLYTVPGGVLLNVPRQLALRDADGVVFVADSSWDQIEANIASMQNLRDNLARHGADIDRLPVVLQYNKRDLPHPAPGEYLDLTLNRGAARRHAFPACAASGFNVFNTLNTLCALLLDRP